MPFGIWTRVGPKKHVLDGGCTLAQPGEYDGTVHVLWRCGLCVKLRGLLVIIETICVYLVPVFEIYRVICQKS